MSDEWQDKKIEISPGVYKFDIPREKEYTIGILATTVEAGVEYATVLGIEDYYIVTKPTQGQGLRIKAFIISPGYFDQAFRAFWSKFDGYDVMMQNLAMTANGPMG